MGARVRRAATAGGVVVMTAAAVLLGGCQRPRETDQQRVQREAAESAREVRRDLQDAGTEAQKAAEQLRTETKAALAGAQQGWKEGAPPAGRKGARVDVNSASAEELETLPGISATDARRIVHGRPYGDASELTERGVLSAGEYARVRDRVTAK